MGVLHGADRLHYRPLIGTRPRIETDHYLRFERVDGVDVTDRGVVATLPRECLRVDLIRDDVVRFKISRGGVFDESPTFAVVDPQEASVGFHVETTAEVVRLRTTAMVVSLWLDPFHFEVHRTDGSAVLETARDWFGRPWPYATLNDAFTVWRRRQPDDVFFGLGEKTGRSNRSGRDFTMWNTDVLNPERTAEFTAGRPPGDPRADPTSTEFDPYYVSIPFFYRQGHPDGHVMGSFIDNGYRGHYDFTGGDEYRIHVAGGQYTEYVFAGPDMPTILSRYTELTGRTSPPPWWALGYHQCRWHRYTQAEVEALGQRHRDLGIPCDTLWLDIDHMDGFRVFTWDAAAFPDPAGMLARLSDQGFGVISIVDPGIKHEPGYGVFDQALERDVLCTTEGGDLYVGQVWPGDTVFPDFAAETAREWWGQLNAAHVHSGLAGIWNDMNEPATGSIPPDAMRFDGGRSSHERFHNQYALLMAMGTTEGLLAARPDRRTFVLSRAGFAGIQRYAANWLGDSQSTWEHLAVSLPMSAGLGISGQAFVGADIGGFQGDVDGELFLRWLQYGALTPFCRNHSAAGHADQYVWSFGEVIEGHAREAIRLRYRLLPYLYDAFVRASETGEPVQRPMVFDHQYDRAARDLDDQYLLGRDLLVAPVLVAGMTARQVYLPAGTWYDWHTGESVTGPGFHVATTPMSHIPVFARGGAVVPLWPDAPPSTAGFQPTAVELHLFVPGDDGTHRSTLHEDDGVTFAAVDGTRYRTTFTVQRRGERVRLSVNVDGNGYPEFARTAFHLVIHGGETETLRHDDVVITPTLAPTGRSFVLPNAGTGFTAEILLRR